MSLHDAITQAAQAALEPYLSPDMVDKLTADILDRARPEIEAALSTFVGFEVGKPTAGRAAKAAPKASNSARKPAKRKEAPAASEGDEDPGLGENAAGSEMMMG